MRQNIFTNCYVYIWVVNENYMCSLKDNTSKIVCKKKKFLKNCENKYLLKVISELEDILQN